MTAAARAVGFDGGAAAARGSQTCNAVPLRRSHTRWAAMKRVKRRSSTGADAAAGCDANVCDARVAADGADVVAAQPMRTVAAAGAAEDVAEIRRRTRNRHVERSAYRPLLLVTPTHVPYYYCFHYYARRACQQMTQRFRAFLD